MSSIFILKAKLSQACRAVLSVGCTGSEYSANGAPSLLVFPGVRLNSR